MSLRILFIDMNSYFASVEQQVRPELRRRPVAVVPMFADTTCCIAASYEAKRFGIKTGTLVRDAKAMCPGLQIVEGRHELYVRMHHAILKAVETCAPVQAVHSIDEMSCRLASNHNTTEKAIALAHRIKLAIRQYAGEYMACSIGIGPNRFLAKIAADMQKPDGLTIIQKDELPSRLYSLKLDDLPGIGPRMLRRLQSRGVDSLKQLCAFSEDDLGRLWGGVVGKRMWALLRGYDFHEPSPPRRTVGHSHVLPPSIRTDTGAHAVLIRLLCKAAARMRRLGYSAGRLDTYASFLPEGRWHAGLHLNQCEDTSSLVDAFNSLWSTRRKFIRPLKVGLVLSNLSPRSATSLPLFGGERRRVGLSRMIDRINDRFGRDMVHIGTVHEFLDSAPTRIAFSNVPDLDDPNNWDRNSIEASWWTPPSQPVIPDKTYAADFLEDYCDNDELTQPETVA